MRLTIMTLQPHNQSTLSSHSVLSVLVVTGMVALLIAVLGSYPLHIAILLLVCAIIGSRAVATAGASIDASTQVSNRRILTIKIMDFIAGAASGSIIGTMAWVILQYPDWSDTSLFTAMVQIGTGLGVGLVTAFPKAARWVRAFYDLLSHFVPSGF